MQLVTRRQRHLCTDPVLQFTDDGSHVTTADVEAHRDAAAGILALHLIGAHAHVDAGYLLQRHERAVRRWDCQRLEGLDGLSQRRMQSDHGVDHAFAFIHHAGMFAGEGSSYGTVHIVDPYTEACACGAVGRDHDLWQTTDGLHVDVGRTVDRGSDIADAMGQRGKRIQIVAEDLDHHILSGARHQLVKAHLDRLLKAEGHTGNHRQGLLHLRCQLLAVRG